VLSVRPRPRSPHQDGAVPPAPRSPLGCGSVGAAQGLLQLRRWAGAGDAIPSSQMGTGGLQRCSSQRLLGLGAQLGLRRAWDFTASGRARLARSAASARAANGAHHGQTHTLRNKAPGRRRDVLLLFSRRLFLILGGGDLSKLTMQTISKRVTERVYPAKPWLTTKGCFPDPPGSGTDPILDVRTETLRFHTRCTHGELQEMGTSSRGPNTRDRRGHGMFERAERAILLQWSHTPAHRAVPYRATPCHTMPPHAARLAPRAALPERAPGRRG